MNPFFAFLSAAFIFAIFFLADSGAVSRVGEFNAYSLLHIPLYGILTFLILLSFCTGKGRYTSARLIAGGAFAGLVGLLDELFQSYIPSREGSLGDVLLDFLGIAAALLLFRRFFPVLRGKSARGSRRN